MERREFIALIGMAAAAMPSRAGAQPVCSEDSLVSRVVGTWRFASSINTRSDGTVFDRWGSNPKGVIMFDRGGHYSQIIVRSESRVFGGKLFCAFGSYSVDDAKKVLKTRIDGCSVSRLNGIEQDRTIIKLTADELQYWNPITAAGATAEVLWKRLS